MPFKPPSWVPDLPIPIPNLPINTFIFSEPHGRCPKRLSLAPFVCGVTGKSDSVTKVEDEVDFLARGLSAELQWRPNEGTEWDKVAAIFSLNTVDYLPLSWAVHRLGGIVTPANAQYTASDLEYQLRSSKASVLFTCAPLLDTALSAAERSGIPPSRVFLLDFAPSSNGEARTEHTTHKTTRQLIEHGKVQRTLEILNWPDGESRRRTAFLCYSSGTSGLPKGVMISHHNVIANTLQIATFDRPSREKLAKSHNEPHREHVLGLLPLSHIYGLIVIAHTSVYRGDGVVILPQFSLSRCLKTIQDYKISTLFLVPPIIILMAKNNLEEYDLSSVREIFTGAAPLRQETAAELNAKYPSWIIKQGYGLTETCTLVCSSAPFDIFPGSCGSLLPQFEVRIVGEQGKEVTEYGETGELLVKSPTLVLGYLNNESANAETFVTDSNGDRWMRTGDEAMVQQCPSSGNEHIFITDRIKELIKVKGLQVAPAELEAYLLTHPQVSDCAVVAIPDAMAGEVPKAFVVKASRRTTNDAEELAEDILQYVRKNKARHKWIDGGITFVDVIPKSPSGKILRRLLKDMEKKKRSAAKL